MKKLIISQREMLFSCWYVLINKDKLYKHYHEKYLLLNEKEDKHEINIEYAKVCAGVEGPKMFISSMTFIIGALITLSGIVVGGSEGKLKEDIIHYGVIGLLAYTIFFVFDQLAL